jgi:hypothetical protein
MANNRGKPKQMSLPWIGKGRFLAALINGVDMPMEERIVSDRYGDKARLVRERVKRKHHRGVCDRADRPAPGAILTSISGCNLLFIEFVAN